MPFRLAPCLFLSAFIAFSGCSGSKPEDPKELTDPSQKEAIEVSLDTPELTLLETGKRYFNSQLYSLAKQNFEALRAGYPNSQWSEFAQIKIADCLFETGEYAEAAKAYEDFVKNKPAAEGAPYMLFRAARSNQLLQKGVGRDPAPFHKALDLYNQLLTQYPDSAYSESGKKFRSEVVDNLVASEERIKHFYEKRRNQDAAIARESAIQQEWVPVVKETRYEEPPQQETAPEGAAAPVSAPEQATDTITSHGRTIDTIALAGRILKIECSTGETRGVFVYFDREVPVLQSYKRSQRVLSRNGSISITMPRVIAPEQNSDCFGQKDLTLRTDGTVSVKSAHDGTAMSLSNPPRLFISVP